MKALVFLLMNEPDPTKFHVKFSIHLQKFWDEKYKKLSGLNLYKNLLDWVKV